MNIITKMITFGEPIKIMSGIICGVLLTAYSSCAAGWSVSSDKEKNYWLMKACDVATDRSMHDCILGALHAHGESSPCIVGDCNLDAYTFGYNLQMCNEEHDWERRKFCFGSAIHKPHMDHMTAGLCAGLGADSGLFDACLNCVLEHKDTTDGVLFGDSDHSFTGNYDYCGCKEDHGLVTFSKKTDCK